MGTGVGERLPWVTLHSWPSASKSRLHLMGNIDIQTDEIQATAVVGHFFLRESQLQTEGTHRSQEGFLHAQIRFTGVSGRPAGLKGSDASQETSLFYGIVLELGSPETPHTEETSGR